MRHLTSFFFLVSSQEPIHCDSPRKQTSSFLLEIGRCSRLVLSGEKRKDSSLSSIYKDLKTTFLFLSLTYTLTVPLEIAGVSDFWVLLRFYGMGQPVLPSPHCQTLKFTWLYWLNSVTPVLHVSTFGNCTEVCCLVPDILLFMLAVLCPITPFPVILAELSESQGRVMGSSYHVYSSPSKTFYGSIHIQHAVIVYQGMSTPCLAQLNQEMLKAKFTPLTHPLVSLST